MGKTYVSKIQIMKYLKEGLVLLGYPDDIRIHTYIMDNNRPRYYFTYKDDRGNKLIKTFGIRDMMNILQTMNVISGCEKSDIDIKVKDGNVSYFLKTDLVPKNKKRLTK